MVIKNLIKNRLYFDKLYIFGPIGDQYKDFKSFIEEADVEFINDIRDLPSPEQLPKGL